MSDNQIGARLKKVIEEHYKMSPHAFSQKYNDKGGVKTSQVIRGRNGLSSKLLDSIVGAYPEINSAWLLTGEGQMIKKGSSPVSVGEDPEDDFIHLLRKVYSKSDELAKSNEELKDSYRELVKTNQILANSNSLLVEKLADLLVEINELRAQNGVKYSIHEVSPQISSDIKEGYGK